MRVMRAPEPNWKLKFEEQGKHINQLKQDIERHKAISENQESEIARLQFELEAKSNEVAIADEVIEKLKLERDDMRRKIETLFDAIAHGDPVHRAWLKEAIEAHFKGQPVPSPRSGADIKTAGNE